MSTTFFSPLSSLRFQYSMCNITGRFLYLYIASVHVRVLYIKYTFLHLFYSRHMEIWLWTHKLKPHVRHLLRTEIYFTKLPLYAHKFVIYYIWNGLLVDFIHLRCIFPCTWYEHIAHRCLFALLLQNAIQWPWPYQKSSHCFFVWSIFRQNKQTILIFPLQYPSFFV